MSLCSSTHKTQPLSNPLLPEKQSESHHIPFPESSPQRIKCSAAAFSAAHSPSPQEQVAKPSATSLSWRRISSVSPPQRIKCSAAAFSAARLAAAQRFKSAPPHHREREESRGPSAAGNAVPGNAILPNGVLVFSHSRHGQNNASPREQPREAKPLAASTRLSTPLRCLSAPPARLSSRTR